MVGMCSIQALDRYPKSLEPLAVDCKRNLDLDFPGASAKPPCKGLLSLRWGSNAIHMLGFIPT